MSRRSNGPAQRPVTVALCLMALAVRHRHRRRRHAHASYYKMLLCAGNVGSNGFTPRPTPPARRTPAASSSSRITAAPPPTQPATTPSCGSPRTSHRRQRRRQRLRRHLLDRAALGPIVAGGGYTREPNAFNEGWRGRFWAEGYDGCTNNILMQGSGVANGSLGGIGWADLDLLLSPVALRRLRQLPPLRLRADLRPPGRLRPHQLQRRRCQHPDPHPQRHCPSHINFTSGGSPLLSGEWVRGPQNVTWNIVRPRLGPALRAAPRRRRPALPDRLRAATATSTARPAAASSPATSSPARPADPGAAPTPSTPSSLSDGAHTVQVCAQDYGQSAGPQRHRRGKLRPAHDPHRQHRPRRARAASTSPAPTRPATCDHFGASWSLPPNSGPPDREGPLRRRQRGRQRRHARDSHLRDQPDRAHRASKARQRQATTASASGWRTQSASPGRRPRAPIPHDTTPPAAPQGLSVTAPRPRRAAPRASTCAGATSPTPARRSTPPTTRCSTAPARSSCRPRPSPATTSRRSPNLEAPERRGNYKLRLWLPDEEGNVGAPVSAPLAYDCMRSPVPGGTQLSAALGGQRSPDRAAGPGLRPSPAPSAARADLADRSGLRLQPRRHRPGPRIPRHRPHRRRRRLPLPDPAGPLARAQRDLPPRPAPAQRHRDAPTPWSTRPSRRAAPSSATSTSPTSKATSPAPTTTRSSSSCRSEAARAGSPSAATAPAKAATTKSAYHFRRTITDQL